MGDLECPRTTDLGAPLSVSGYPVVTGSSGLAGTAALISTRQLRPHAGSSSHTHQQSTGLTSHLGTVLVVCLSIVPTSGGAKIPD